MLGFFRRIIPRAFHFASLDAAFNRIRFKSNALELGFVLLRGRIGSHFARHIFFGRGSFPDVDVDSAENQKVLENIDFKLNFLPEI